MKYSLPDSLCVVRWNWAAVDFDDQVARFDALLGGAPFFRDALYAQRLAECGHRHVETDGRLLELQTNHCLLLSSELDK